MPDLFHMQAPTSICSSEDPNIDREAAGERKHRLFYRRLERLPLCPQRSVDVGREIR